MLRNLNEYDFINWRFFSFHTFLALDAFHLSYSCFRRYQTFSFFFLRCDIFAVLFSFPFLFLFVYHTISSTMSTPQNQLEINRDFFPRVLTSFKGKSAVHPYLTGGEMCIASYSGCEHLRTTMPKNWLR